MIATFCSTEEMLSLALNVQLLLDDATEQGDYLLLHERKAIRENAYQCTSFDAVVGFRTPGRICKLFLGGKILRHPCWAFSNEKKDV